jgi:hypothetical protein
MASLTPTQVNTTRTLTVWITRSVATVLLATGSYLFLKKLLFAIGSGPGGFNNMFRVHMEIGEAQSTYRGLGMLVVGTALAVGARRVARWIVAMPESGCPRCLYAGAVTSTCPECGLGGLDEGERSVSE